MYILCLHNCYERTRTIVPMYRTEVGIYKQKQDRKNSRFRPREQSRKKKENTLSTEKAIKKKKETITVKKNEENTLDRVLGRPRKKKEKNFLFSCSFSWSLSWLRVCFLSFFLAFLFKFKIPTSGHRDL